MCQNIARKANIEGMISSVTKLASITSLFDYYKPEEVLGYCKSCPNHGQIWSCPPYERDEAEFMKAYDEALIIGIRTKTFGPTKKSLGRALIEMSKRYPVEVLIAGNCFLCKPCTKVSGKPCAHPDQMKYSLESLGFHVSDICENLLGVSLEWDTDNPTYLATAAVLFKESNVNQDDKEKLTERILHELGID